MFPRNDKLFIIIEERDFVYHSLTLQLHFNAYYTFYAEN